MMLTVYRFLSAIKEDEIITAPFQGVHMSYAWESFNLAMHTLASRESQRDRLLRAYKLNLMQLDQKDVPKEIRDEFSQLTRNIGRFPVQEGECIIKRTVESLEDNEIELMIDSIIRMYDAVARYQPLPRQQQRQG
ncbi:MAG: hypothetical protein JWQ23_3774 [Herminiimonas sp.]|jgi:hypothetical protein|nr:hypothetical protein [Herminiimonas sp.]